MKTSVVVAEIDLEPIVGGQRDVHEMENDELRPRRRRRVRQYFCQVFGGLGPAPVSGPMWNAGVTLTTDPALVRHNAFSKGLDGLARSSRRQKAVPGRRSLLPGDFHSFVGNRSLNPKGARHWRRSDCWCLAEACTFGDIVSFVRFTYLIARIGCDLKLTIRVEAARLYREEEIH